MIRAARCAVSRLVRTVLFGAALVLAAVAWSALTAWFWGC